MTAPTPIDASHVIKPYLKLSDVYNKYYNKIVSLKDTLMFLENIKLTTEIVLR